jgi:hypothetical protein
MDLDQILDQALDEFEEQEMKDKVGAALVEGHDDKDLATEKHTEDYRRQKMMEMQQMMAEL